MQWNRNEIPWRKCLTISCELMKEDRPVWLLVGKLWTFPDLSFPSIWEKICYWLASTSVYGEISCFVKLLGLGKDVVRSWCREIRNFLWECLWVVHQEQGSVCSWIGCACLKWHLCDSGLPVSRIYINISGTRNACSEGWKMIVGKII